MHHYGYVPKKDAGIYRDRFYGILRTAQQTLRERFTFSFALIGPGAQNMITRDRADNTGFDYDIELRLNKKAADIPAAELAQLLTDAIAQAAAEKGPAACRFADDSILLTMTDPKREDRAYSCDFTIVREQPVRQRIVSGTDGFIWEEYPDRKDDLEDRILWIKGNNLWDELLDGYLETRNDDAAAGKRALTLYYEAIETVCRDFNY